MSEKITDSYGHETLVNYIYGTKGVEGFKVIMEEYGEKFENSFYYIKDVMGNVRNIVDKDQQLVVSYYYNSWGEIFPQYGDVYSISETFSSGFSLSYGCDLFAFDEQLSFYWG